MKSSTAKSRPSQLRIRLAILCMAACSGAVARSEPLAAFERLLPAVSPQLAVRVLDTDAMPITGPGAAVGVGEKILFTMPNGGHARIIYAAPGDQGSFMHYHEFHEWAYNISGDYPCNEATTADQVSGPLQRYTEGYFLSRPPFSLHGSERGRQKFMGSQTGAAILIMEEAHVLDRSFIVDPVARTVADPVALQGMRYNADYAHVTHWATPRIIDTLDKMPWQPIESSPGLNAKFLDDDPAHGFRATLYFLEAGARGARSMRPASYTRAHQFMFMITGDLKLVSLDTRGGHATTTQLSKHSWVDRPPGSIAGISQEVATQGGAVWLEVTYARGTAWTDAPTPIEEPAFAD